MFQNLSYNSNSDDFITTHFEIYSGNLVNNLTPHSNGLCVTTNHKNQPYILNVNSVRRD